MAGVWLKPEKGSESIKAEKGLCVVLHHFGLISI